VTGNTQEDETQGVWPFISDERIDPSSLSARGRVLLQVATEVFLELGYGATSVDEIVARARSSKATVYKLFVSKERLFAAVVDNIVGTIEHPITLDDQSGDLETTLQQVAEEHLAVVFSERHVRLMRMVAAEAGRFPELGAAYYSHGPALGHQKVAVFLRGHAAKGTIVCDDPVAAAEDFWGIVLHSGTLARLYGVMPAPKSGWVEKQASSSVERFLRLYPTQQEGHER
jgi:TetR/AcrR family transcriptional repressor of mexJK operon